MLFLERTACFPKRPSRTTSLKIISSLSGYYPGPLDIPDLRRALEQSLDHAIHVRRGRCQGIDFSSRPPDSFSGLPMEILQEILLCLPPTNVVNLKVASSTFAIVPLTQRFWASRFQRGFEFHHIFEARQGHTKSRCWRTLYMGVRRLKGDPSFRDKCQLWNHFLRLESVLGSLPSGPPRRSSVAVVFRTRCARRRLDVGLC